MGPVLTLDKLDEENTYVSTKHNTIPVARGLFLVAALLSFGLSVGLYFADRQTDGIFVGLWVPSILALGAFLAPRHLPNGPS